MTNEEKIDDIIKKTQIPPTQQLTAFFVGNQMAEFMVDKASEWLSQHAYEYFYSDEELGTQEDESFIEDFRKAMLDEELYQ